MQQCRIKDRQNYSALVASTCTTDISDELKLIHQSLLEIRTSMVKNDDIKSIVTTIVSEIKRALKKEISQEVKEALSKEIATTVTAKVRVEFDNKIHTKTCFFFNLKRFGNEHNRNINTNTQEYPVIEASYSVCDYLLIKETVNL